MTKYNFSKIEKAIEEGIRKIWVRSLLDLADIAAGIGTPKKKKQLTEEQRLLIQSLKINMLRLRQKDRHIYAKIKIKKETLQILFERPHTILEKEWKKVKKLHQVTEDLIKEYYPEMNDEDLVAHEKKRHVNKRFNVDETWLPLY